MILQCPAQRARNPESPHRPELVTSCTSPKGYAVTESADHKFQQVSVPESAPSACVRACCGTSLLYDPMPLPHEPSDPTPPYRTACGSAESCLGQRREIPAVTLRFTHLPMGGWLASSQEVEYQGVCQYRRALRDWHV